MKVRIAKERSDLCDLTAAAIKATYNTRNPCEVERCIDVLNHLKSLSLSVKDIRLSKSIVKLETLRSHRNLRIRKEAQALFHSWLKTFYGHGSDNSFKAALTKDRLKMKKHVLTRCSELKNKENERSQMTVEAVEKDHKSETREEKYFKKETKTNLKQLNMKTRRVSFEDVTTKKPHEDGSLIKKTKTEKELLKKKKVDEMVKLFEAAKKAADVANAKGVLSDKPEASRCIDALSLLKKINITPKPKEPRRMMDKLEGLTKHKDRKICHVASALLHLWRQRIREQERKKSVTKASSKNIQRRGNLVM
ncbi:Transcription elongation factor TFIIS/CRSP70 N-terminal sub-type [Arabidopsis suecica]|uniref:Transcription elongation factor TFIIS/CRSP70 N-terminal sub-type n=1 Tax=Arabidopsis suecica TaxID=45249 RepID=A0A8T2FXN1_ARASU|nr:Transcription elongation factor TFIIS/CRSP70 N-terminal sub-type [Arabidopsis suecica]